MKKIIIIAAGILFALSLPVLAQWSEPEIVDGSGNADDIGKWANISVDSDDNIHIVYHDSSAGYLHYAKKTEDGWDIQGGNISSVVGYISADMADDNTVHASYVAEDGGNDVFKYATYTGGGWEQHTAYDPGLGEGLSKDNSIIVDHEGYVHISMYVHETSSGLYYTTNLPNGGGTFIVPDHVGGQVIDSGWGNSIGYGKGDDNLFIGYNEQFWQYTDYYDMTNCLTKSRRGGAWDDLGDVDDDYDVPKGKIISLDVVDDKPHMVYTQNGKMVYAAYDGNDWKKDFLKKSSKFAALYMKSKDEPYIVFFDDTDNSDWGIKVAYKDPDTDEWGYETIDDTVGDYSDDGCTPSITMDSQGVIHVAYYSADNQSLKYSYSENVGSGEIPDLEEDDEVIIGNNKFDPTNDDSCRIMYNLSKNQQITIKIYDLRGNLVETIIENEEKEEGRHGEDEWNGRNLNDSEVASGIYYVVIESNDGWKKVNKVAIVKGGSGN
ncbi:T9SS type A sorting domain-containing protein [Elusimicrobiota bacterium]